MSWSRRLRRLVQVDVDAYFIFRNRLDADVGPGSGENDSGIGYTVIEQDKPDREALDKLIHLMQSAGLLSLDENQARQAVEQRFRNGDACAVAWDASRLVGFAWIAGTRSDVYDRFARCASRIHGAVVLYQAFVETNYRGRGIHRRLDGARKAYLRSSGVEESITFVGVKNFASVRNSMRTNDQYKLIYHLAVKGPKGITGNFYPKWAGEPWTPCK